MKTPELHNQDVAPRLRLTKTIDLSKADPRCDRCHGEGVARYDKRDIPGEGMIEVPVICRCVSRNGGVKKDAFDRMMEQLEQQVHSGAWARDLAGDVLRLPPDRREEALGRIEGQAADESKPDEIRDAICEAVELIKQGMAAKPQMED